MNFRLRTPASNGESAGVWARETFADKLRGFREQRALGQIELAARSGLNSQHIAKLEAGKRHPTLTTLAALACGLDARLIIEPDGALRWEAWYGS